MLEFGPLPFVVVFIRADCAEDSDSDGADGADGQKGVVFVSSPNPSIPANAITSEPFARITLGAENSAWQSSRANALR